nr:ORF6N domain-containing protein [uncultured Prevotella sp.]
MDTIDDKELNSNILVTQQAVESRIYTIRGLQVVLDSDLAEFYGVETKQLKRQVKRNIERFPEDFMFQLKAEEMNSLRCQNGTSNVKGGNRYPNYAFTEQGVSQLAGILRSPNAIEINICIMGAFVSMRRFLSANAGIFQRVEQLEYHQQVTDQKVEQVLHHMDELAPAITPEQIFATGCVWDAWVYVSQLIRSAQKRIVLIDSYVDERVLTLLTKRKEKVKATIHTRFTNQFKLDLEKHNEQYAPIEYIQLPHRSHDRFLIIDADAYLLGTSVKDMGTSLCAITKLEVSPETVLELLE